MRVRQGGNIPLSGLLKASKLNAAANAAAAITVTGVAGRRIVVERIIWSYSDNPTGGKLTLSGGGTNYEFDITTGGPGSISLDYVGSVFTDVVVTLAAGGAGITGKVNLEYTLEM